MVTIQRFGAVTGKLENGAMPVVIRYHNARSLIPLFSYVKSFGSNVLDSSFKTATVLAKPGRRPGLRQLQRI